jgi:outer membrane protein assembly factor BamB
MSPVADGQTLIVAPNGPDNAAVVALNKETGETLWHSGNFKVSYASPVVATLNGQKQYVIIGEEGLHGLDPATGHELWQLPWPTLYGGKKGPTPVVVGDRIFVATTEGGYTGLVDVANATPTVLWKHKEMQDHFPTSIYYHTRIYGSSEPKFMVSLDPGTGKILWKQETGQYTSVIGVDDTVIGLSGKTGELVMLDASSAEYKELGRCTPLGGPSWAPPVIADGHLFVRNQKELACLELK